MPCKRTYSEAYGAQTSANKAGKFSGFDRAVQQASAGGKFNRPSVFDPRYQEAEEYWKGNDDDDDSEEEEEDEDEDDEGDGEEEDEIDEQGKGVEDEEYMDNEDGGDFEEDEDDSDEEDDEESDEEYSEEDNCKHDDDDSPPSPQDSGYDSCCEQNEKSVEPSEELTRNGTILELNDYKPANMAYWLRRKLRSRRDNNFPSILIIRRSSFTMEQLHDVLDLVQPEKLMLNNYTPADGFWGMMFQALGERKLRFLKITCKADMMGWKVARRSGAATERYWPGDGLNVKMEGYEEVAIGTVDYASQFEDLAGRSATMF
ncbi:Hypothetical predicted protein [Lecanosticta acicola]|uniref:Uncharacterized protein n=1 Tax=Lecanosticta acicola TaxID=111012 RepID=A0AAI8YTU5_9PEZI|nr:Hypothetical predicted protein [Lecanosticta acicola]